MKFLKSTLAIIALCAIGFVCAKTTASRKEKIVPQANATETVTTQPIAQPKSTSIKKTITKSIAPLKPTITKKVTTVSVVQSAPTKTPLNQPQVQKPTAQAQSYTPVLDVIMILDPDKNESLNPSGALTTRAITALQEKAAPIIMSSNILKIITDIRQIIGPKDLQELRTIIETTTDIGAMLTLAQKLLQSKKLSEHPTTLNFISIINFDSKNFNCYLHNTANLVLVIPKQYIQSNIPKAANLNPNDQAKACGFNPAVMTAVDDLSANNLIKKLQAQQSGTIKNKETFVTSLTSMFIPQKKNGQLISPEQDTKWAVYIIGHGGPTGTIPVREQLASCQKLLATWKTKLAKDKNNNLAKQYIATNQSEIKKYETILSENPNAATTISGSAHIAGLSDEAFSQLMQFFDKNINIAFLHYSSCFSGGYNQSFVNKTLSSLDVNFIVSAEGVHEAPIIASSMIFIPNSSNTRLTPNEQPFTNFFRLLNLFIGQPEEFVKIKEEKKDPIAQILGTIVPNMQKENQPFVRFPSTGVFEAISLVSSTKSATPSTITKNLTQTIVKAHEIEKKAIDVSNPNIGIITVNPSRISVPINFGKNAKCAIVSPSPSTTDPSYEAIHVFKEVNFENTLQTLLFNFIHLNARMHTQTFIINTLTGILGKESNLPVTPSGPNIIRNLIIQMKGIPGATMSVKTEVSFELNKNVYWYSATISGFDNPNLQKNLTTLTFTSIKTKDMNTLANKFLTTQEIAKLKKPITLDSIAQFIDSKIDQQESTIFQQPSTDNKALLEFAKERTNK